MSAGPIAVSAHALVRYAERIVGIQVPARHRIDRNRRRQLRDLIAWGFDRNGAEAALQAMAAAAGCSIFDEREEVYVYLPAVTLVVKERTVVTVFPAGMVYEPGYYAARRPSKNK